MAEEIEGQDIGAEAVAGGIDPAAVALALNGASREEADAFLEEQRKLIQLQAKELAHELKLRHWSLWVRHASGLLKLALEFSVGLLLLFAVAAISVMVWNAAHADGLIIESFSVPPDLASRGLTGQVVAIQMLDKLTGMQNASKSLRSPQSYANNWGDDIQVQIPETGVSVGEAYRFLRKWLGHETHITGEVYRTTGGLVITARSGRDAGATYAGPESDLDGLLQKAAEHVYGATQPYRFARYLSFTTPPRADEARAIFNQLIDSADPHEEAWAWNGLAVMSANVEANLRATMGYEKSAITTFPDFIPPYSNRGAIYDADMGHAEAALADNRKALQLLNQSSITDIDSHTVTSLRLRNGVFAAAELGDYTNAINLARRGAELHDTDDSIAPTTFRELVPRWLAKQHDGTDSRIYLSGMPPSSTGAQTGARAVTRFQIDAALENWSAVAAMESFVEKIYTESTPRQDLQTIFSTEMRPFLALAKAKLGDIAGAEAVITTTPSDCYDCVRIRGIIASEAKQYGRADYWFAHAVQQAPSIPMAFADWGQSLLLRGKPDEAIVKLTLANQKGPHFADPLEGLGEALMAKNRSDLAQAKFEEADKYAPNWGRLHLKWGEALYYAGKTDEARAQYQKASTLDLTAADKTELARVSAHV